VLQNISSISLVRPIPVAPQSKGWVRGLSLLGSPVRILPGAWIFVFFYWCVLSGRGHRFLLQRIPTDCGGSECDQLQQ